MIFPFVFAGDTYCEQEVVKIFQDDIFSDLSCPDSVSSYLSLEEQQNYPDLITQLEKRCAMSKQKRAKYSQHFRRQYRNWWRNGVKHTCNSKQKEIADILNTLPVCSN